MRDTTFAQARIAWENGFLLSKLAEHDGNISATARAIGLTREHLSRRLSQMEPRQAA